MDVTLAATWTAIILLSYYVFRQWTTIKNVVEHYSQQNKRIADLSEHNDYLQNHNQQLVALQSEHTQETLLLENELNGMTEEMRKQKGRAQSAHTSKGQILEKWAPFVENDNIDEHWRPEDWCFLGQPIDYVVFDWFPNKGENKEKGKVVLLDVKAAKSQLTTKQRRIRDLIQDGKVEWREIRLD